MKLEHEFRVPVPITQAWDVLLDVERIAPCMPGATVESFDGETVHGRVKVKVGPIQVTYSGTAKFIEKDEPGRRVTFDASGKEARGSGTAKATIVAVLQDEGASTLVTVTTDLAITGKPAQFGRGVMVEVGNKLLGRFADCLAEQIGIGSTPDSPASIETAAAAATAANEGTAAANEGTAAANEGTAAANEGTAAANEGTAAANEGTAAADEVTAAASEVTAAASEVTAGSGAGAAALGEAPAAAVASDGDVSSGATAGHSVSGNGAGTSPPPIRTLTSAPPIRPLTSAPTRPAHDEAIDLLDLGGAAIAKRVAPVAFGLVVLFLLWRLARRR